MRVAEAAKYLEYANPDADVVVLNKECYNILLEKAKKFDRIMSICKEERKKDKK